TGTGNQFDIAIDGAKGLFRLQDSSGSILYSRNGQFFANAQNHIVNAQGHQLTGYVTGSTTPSPIVVPSGNIPPQATADINIKANFDANATVISAATPFDPTNGDSFTHSQPIDVYDSLGNAHQLMQYFVKREGESGTASKWDVYYRLD